MKKSLTLVLVSTSPRRISLLKEVGLSFQVLPPNADETPLPGETPQKLVKRLARSKAESVLGHPLLQKAKGNTLLISADTIVVGPDKKTILGKPKNAKDAVRMLTTLAGETHTVLTGYALFLVQPDGCDEVIRVVRTEVKMRPLSSMTIQRYVATGEPLDKAGSYGAQGMGMALVESIRGSYTNVVGLPMSQILTDIESLCQIPLLSWMPRQKL